MRASEIRKIIEKNKLNEYVVALDEFYLMRNIHYIINSDPSYLPGRHWMCVYNDSRTEFWDPIGRQPGVYGIELVNYVYNSVRVQGPSSCFCGEFCIYLLYCTCLGYTMLDVINSLTEDFALKDRIAKEFVNKIK